MNNINSRFNYLLDYMGLSNPVLERHTGIKSTIWANVRNGKSRVNEDHLEAINKMWPQYSYWITTGQTLVQEKICQRVCNRGKGIIEMGDG